MLRPRRLCNRYVRGSSPIIETPVPFQCLSVNARQRRLLILATDILQSGDKSRRSLAPNRIP